MKKFKPNTSVSEPKCIVSLYLSADIYRKLNKASHNLNMSMNRLANQMIEHCLSDMSIFDKESKRENDT